VPQRQLYTLDGMSIPEFDAQIGVVAKFNEQQTRAGRGTITVVNICGADRRDNTSTIYSYLLQTVALREAYPPGIVVGFDLMDEEDRYYPLLYYLDDFLAIANFTRSRKLDPLKFFFHAGETTWNKRQSENLYDALLLNTFRIGHGFALGLYPELISAVRSKGVGVEVCPLSNQMLRLVNDLRDHPANILASHGLPLTLSSDDSSIYGYSGTTPDMWSAYMAWNLTLTALKQLAINSLQYSSLLPDNKTLALKQWQASWERWVDRLVD